MTFIGFVIGLIIGLAIRSLRHRYARRQMFRRIDAEARERQRLNTEWLKHKHKMRNNK